MAIVQISKIQQRRGLSQDLPQLAAGEIGWSIDSRKLYIGNGLISDGAPVEGHTEILTEFSILDFTNSVAGNVAILQSNVAVLQSNIVTIESEIVALQAATTTSNVTALGTSSTGSFAGFPATNATITYTLIQGSAQRTGVIRASRIGSSISYDEEYTQTGTTDISFTLTANATYGIVSYTTITSTSLTFKIVTQ
jgi:hypothetical protein